MIAVWFWRVMMAISMASIVQNAIAGHWLPWVPMCVFATMCYIFLCQGALSAHRRDLARKDLRDVYPPERDQFYRDLERLSKLRGASVVKDPAVVEVQAKIDRRREEESRERLSESLRPYYQATYSCLIREAYRASDKQTGHGTCLCRECIDIQQRYFYDQRSSS